MSYHLPSLKVCSTCNMSSSSLESVASVWRVTKKNYHFKLGNTHRLIMRVKITFLELDLFQNRRQKTPWKYNVFAQATILDLKTLDRWNLQKMFACSKRLHRPPRGEFNISLSQTQRVSNAQDQDTPPISGKQRKFWFLEHRSNMPISAF